MPNIRLSHFILISLAAVGHRELPGVVHQPPAGRGAAGDGRGELRGRHQLRLCECHCGTADGVVWDQMWQRARSGAVFVRVARLLRAHSRAKLCLVTHTNNIVIVLAPALYNANISPSVSFVFGESPFSQAGYFYWACWWTGSPRLSHVWFQAWFAN